MKRQPKLSGKLAEPLPPFEVTLAMQANPDEMRRLVAEREQLEREKLELLAETYGIPVSATRWYELALALGREACPGLRVKAPMGRKTVWGDMARGVLVVEIEREKKLLPKSVTPSAKFAAQKLSKKEPWKSFLMERQIEDDPDRNPDPVEVLRKVYTQECKGRWAKVCRQAFAYHEVTDNLKGWDQFVDECLGGSRDDLVLSQGRKKKGKKL